MSPRPGSRKKYDTWCPTAIREMLRREIYIGRIVWNKSKWIKKPETNNRVRRPRPQSEWKISDRPELRIVPQKVWEAVQHKNALTAKKYGVGAQKGLETRARTSPYLLSGFLKCSRCGANLIIVFGKGKLRGLRWARYGCSQHWNRGACDNNLTLRRDDAEHVFLGELQEFMKRPEAIACAIEEFRRQLTEALQSEPGSTQQMISRKAQIEKELEALVDSLARGMTSSKIRSAIAKRESELKDLAKKQRDLCRYAEDHGSGGVADRSLF